MCHLIVVGLDIIFFSNRLLYINIFPFSGKRYNPFCGEISFYPNLWKHYWLAGLFYFTHSIIVHIIWEKPAHNKFSCSSHPVNAEVRKSKPGGLFVCLKRGIHLPRNSAKFFCPNLINRITKFSLFVNNNWGFGPWNQRFQTNIPLIKILYIHYMERPHYKLGLEFTNKK